MQAYMKGWKETLQENRRRRLLRRRALMEHTQQLPATARGGAHATRGLAPPRAAAAARSGGVSLSSRRNTSSSTAARQRRLQATTWSRNLFEAEKFVEVASGARMGVSLSVGGEASISRASSQTTVSGKASAGFTVEWFGNTKDFGWNYKFSTGG